MQREAAWWQLARKVEMEARFACELNLAGEHDLALAAGNHVAAFRSRALDVFGRDCAQRLAHDVIAARMLLQELDVAGDPKALLYALDARDESATRNGIGIE